MYLANLDTVINNLTDLLKSGLVLPGAWRLGCHRSGTEVVTGSARRVAAGRRARWSQVEKDEADGCAHRDGLHDRPDPLDELVTVLERQPEQGQEHLRGVQARDVGDDVWGAARALPAADRRETGRRANA